LEIEWIEIDRIVEDPDQPRKRQDEEGLQGLADSIRQHGVLQPITVMPLASVNMYKIITGERRWRAAQRAGLEVMPCIVRENPPDDVLTEQLIENIQREDLQPLEKARALESVKQRLGATNRELGSRLGLSERMVGYLLDLLELPEPIAREVVSSPNRPADGQITEKHARFLKQLNDDPDLQAAVAEKIREEKINSDQTGRLVKALRRQPDRTREIMATPADHLADFFREAEPAEAVVQEPQPFHLSIHAQRILEFLTVLDQVRPAELARREAEQVQEALESLRLAVDALLRECRLETGATA